MQDIPNLLKKSKFGAKSGQGRASLRARVGGKAGVASCIEASQQVRSNEACLEGAWMNRKVGRRIRT